MIGMPPAGRLRSAAFSAALLFFSAAWAEAASADFYPFASRWSKSRTETAGKEDAPDVFRNAAPASGESMTQPPPAVKRTLEGIAPSGETLEIEHTQTFILASDSPISKFAATEEGIADLETADASTLIITAREIGKTVVHVWNGAGRKTFEVRVIPRKFTGPTYMDLKRDEIQKTRPFKVRFTADTGQYETGTEFDEMSRRSLDTAETISVDGDTPYGTLHGHAQVRRSGLSTKNILSDAQIKLMNGEIGPARNFNAAVGDSQVKPDFLAFSRGRVRGVAGDTWTDSRRFSLSGFFGREQAGIFAPLSPTATASERTIDSFLSGTVAEYRPTDDFKMRGGYFNGYGRLRPDELNRHSFAWAAEKQIGPHWMFYPEVDFDSEHVAQIHAVRWKDEKAEIRTEFRNINENFQTMVGSPAQQGELGGRIDASITPWERWRFRGLLDVFNDRRIPNPDSLDERNVHAESEIIYAVGDRSALSFLWRDWDDTGRVSPAHERSMGLQYTEAFEAFGRTISVNLRGNNRRSRFLTQPLSNYDRNELGVGVFFPIFWDIRFSLQKEWHWLEDLNLPGRWSQPEMLTLSLGYSHRLWQTPLYLDLDFRWRDEEETESPNSFMSGEDATEISAGLYYRETEDLELYLKGELQNYNPESAALTDNRIEGQVLAGMRWDWDTGVRWTGVGHVKGSVFKDENQNGTRDPGEPGLAGIAVETATGLRATSDADGNFEIRNIADRSVMVTVEAARLPSGYAPTSSVLREIEVPINKTVALEFGFAPLSEAVGVVFNDLNGNGRLDTGEPGIGRVRLKMDGKSVSSNPTGQYAFRGAPQGPHEIELDLASVAEGYLPADAVRIRFELTEGMRYEWNVPLRAYRVVSGRVFRDRDSNGAFSEPEDEPAAGVGVRLGTLRQATDEEGRFLFDNVPAGRHELSVDPAAVRPDEKAAPLPAIELGNEPYTRSDADLALQPKTPKAPSYSPTGSPTGPISTEQPV